MYTEYLLGTECRGTNTQYKFMSTECFLVPRVSRKQTLSTDIFLPMVKCMVHERKLSSNDYVPSVVLTEHSAKLRKTVYKPSPNKLYRVSLSVPSVWLKTLGT
jgi:hypothetical protein